MLLVFPPGQRWLVAIQDDHIMPITRKYRIIRAYSEQRQMTGKEKYQRYNTMFTGQR